MSETSTPEFQSPLPSVQAFEQKPASQPPTEVRSPCHATFGAIEVDEDLNAQLLTEHEQKLYRGGFEVFKEIVTAADNNVEKMVLTTPDMVSGVVGLQPLVSMDTAEAGILYQSFGRAGINFHQDFSMLEFGKERNYLKILVNDRVAENVLRTYQQALGIALPERQLQKDEILTYTMRLLNSSDVRQANLAHGLLSGFPLEDCQQWINSGEAAVNSIPPLRKMDDIDNRFGYQTRTMSDDKQITGRPNFIANLEPENYSLQGSRNQFLPDTRTAISPNAHLGMVEGFGLRWAAQIPPQEATIRHAQKLLQVDREVGLLDYVKQQQSTFNLEDNTKAINIEKELLNKKPATPLGKIGGIAGLAFGIFSIFSSLVEETTKTAKRR
jgi:hypothetical protein